MNIISDEGATQISEALMNNVSLKYLNLSGREKLWTRKFLNKVGNNIGEAGAVSIALSLMSNECLQTLDLSGTNKEKILF